MNKKINVKKTLIFLICSVLLALNSIVSVNASEEITYSIPNNVTVVRNSDVAGLTEVTTLIIHENVTGIGYDVFCNMPKLEKVYVYSKHDFDKCWEFGLKDITGGYDFTLYGYENVRAWVEHMNNPYRDNNMGLGSYMPKSNFINFELLKEEVSTTTPSEQTQQDNIKVYVNGNQVYFDVQPQIINGRTMVPVRAIFEAIGATVTWDAENQRVRASKWYEPTQGIVSAIFTIGSNIMANSFGAPHDYIDTPPIIINGRTLVPARAAAEAFNYNVQWDDATRTVYIYE